MCGECDRLRVQLREATDELDVWRRQSLADPIKGLDQVRLGVWTARLGLTTRQAAALIAFADAPERLMTRDALSPLLCRSGDVFERAVDTRIKALRRALEREFGRERPLLRTIYGLGYLMHTDVALLLKQAVGEAA